MRIRETNSATPTFSWSDSYLHGPNWALFPFTPADSAGVSGTTSLYQKIADVQKGFGNVYNPCTHYTEQWWRNPSISTTSIVARSNVSLPFSRAGTCYTSKVHSAIASEPTVTPIPLFSDVNNLSNWSIPDRSAEALLAMIPAVRTEINLVNSIFELKDFKHLAVSVKHVIARIRKVGLWPWVDEANFYLIARWKNLTLKQVTGLGADSYLQWSFAIRPLISDIVALQRALNRYRNSVSEILAREGSLQKRHWSTNLSLADFGQTQKTPNTPIPMRWDKGWQYHQSSAASWSQIAWNTPPVYHATMLYSYTLSDYDRKHAYGLGLGDALGLNAVFSTIWNALPWSFVVDWVLNVSNWLKQFDPKMLRPIVRIHRFVHSVKLEVEDRVYAWPYCFYNPSAGAASNSNILVEPPTMPYLAKRCRRTFYVRRTTTPNTFALFQTSGLSMSEFSLATALTVPRRWKKPGFKI